MCCVKQIKLKSVVFFPVRLSIISSIYYQTSKPIETMLPLLDRIKKPNIIEFMKAPGQIERKNEQHILQIFDPAFVKRALELNLVHLVSKQMVHASKDEAKKLTKNHYAKNLRRIEKLTSSGSESSTPLTQTRSPSTIPEEPEESELHPEQEMVSLPSSDVVVDLAHAEADDGPRRNEHEQKGDVDTDDLTEIAFPPTPSTTTLAASCTDLALIDLPQFRVDTSTRLPEHISTQNLLDIIEQFSKLRL